MAKLKIDINNPDKIREILQEAYNLAEEQLVQAQNEINKLSNATQLHEEHMDARAKYAKAINDYLAIKDKAIGKKQEVAKILVEIYKHNGNTNGSSESTQAVGANINFDAIRKMVDDSYAEKDKSEKTKIDIRK